MDLGPRDIHDKQFHDAWRGYNQEEVDDFLDRVADVLEQTQRANESLTGRTRELESQLAQAREGEQMLKKTLVTAQQHAEEAVAAARSRAEKILGEANERGRSVLDEARTKATSIESDARRKAQDTERVSHQRKSDLESSIEKLRALEIETRQKLKAFLDAQQRSLTSLSERRPGPPSSQTGPRPQGQLAAGSSSSSSQAGPRPQGSPPGTGSAGPQAERTGSAGPQAEQRNAAGRGADPDPHGDESAAKRTLRTLFGRDEE